MSKTKNKNPHPKWEPWMPEDWKKHYERPKPEKFKRTLHYSAKKLQKGMIVYVPGLEGLYQIKEITEIVIQSGGLWLEVSGRWQRLSEEETTYLHLNDYDEKVNHLIFN